MKRYIIITTLCNNENIANKIIETLLKKNLVAGSHMIKVHSKYWWDNQLEECDEYKLEFRTKENLFREKIKGLGNDEVIEFEIQ